MLYNQVEASSSEGEAYNLSLANLNIPFLWSEWSVKQARDQLEIIRIFLNFDIWILRERGSLFCYFEL